MNPKVTFVVPCYNLAHLLPECINSILVQSYGNFEIIIMDDCSPDATPEVAESFNDSRVRYIRNEKNLKHLANYNKGIGLARGKYVWLISADDRLARPYILERYIRLMDEHPEVGFVFCPAFGLQDGKETGLLDYSFHGYQDRIFPGKQFLKKLLEVNSVVAASAMARKDCYEQIGFFPLDMPYAGDWYLWCLFSIYYDVAYFSEPMVHYRQHIQSMTNILKARTENLLFEDDIKVLSRVRERSKKEKLNSIALKCNSSLAERYINRLALSEGGKTVGPELQGLWKYSDLLEKHNGNQDDLTSIWAGIYAGVADLLYWQGQTGLAKKYYLTAAKTDPKSFKAWAKYTFSLAGRTGKNIRMAITSIKSQNKS